MSEPTITISPALAAYLAKKGFCALVVDAATCKSCGGAIAELFARGIKEKEAQRLAQKGCRMLQAGDFPIYLAHKLVRCDDEISFDLRSLLGVKDVTFQGIHL